jgi:hypothetical protein
MDAQERDTFAQGRAQPPGPRRPARNTTPAAQESPPRPAEPKPAGPTAAAPLQRRGPSSHCPPSAPPVSAAPAQPPPADPLESRIDRTHAYTARRIARMFGVAEYDIEMEIRNHQFRSRTGANEVPGHAVIEWARRKGATLAPGQ